MLKLWQKSQHGSAILIVVFMVGLVLSIITIYVHSEGVMKNIKANQTLRSQRDDVAKSLLSYISNHEIIKYAATPSFTGLSNGNKLLHDCLTGIVVDGCRSFPLESKPGSSDYYNYPQLSLPAPEDFSFPTDKSGGKNCPSKNHPSCNLSGPSSSRKKVGYNFNGETGELSACFPLEPIVYINPECGKDDMGNQKTKCTLVQDIRVAFQLAHRKFNSSCPDLKLSDVPLGITPKELNFITLPRHTLVEYECNEGAFVKGHEAGGDIICECQFPYVPIEGKRNEKGVLCQEVIEKCPGGTTYIGRDQRGKPVCKYLQEMSKPFTKEMHIATSNYPGNFAKEDITCNEHGWLQDLNIDCHATQTPTKEELAGYSCLFFYSFLKFIDGEYLIPGPLPTQFYPDGDKGCYAYNETSTMRAIPQNWWDAACYAAITGLLFIGSASTGKNLFVKKAAGGALSKGSAKVMGKNAAKAAAKKALFIGGAKTSKKAVKSAGKQAAKAAQDAASTAVTKLMKEGITDPKLLKTAAKEAASKAAGETATEAIAKSVKKSSGTVLDNSALVGMHKAAVAAGKNVGGKVTITAGKSWLRYGLERTGETIAEIAVRAGVKYAFRVAAARATKELARENRKNDVEVGGGDTLGGYDSDSVANLIMGDLSPAVFAQTFALDIAMDAYALAAKQLQAIPYVGYALWVAAILAGGYIFAAWQVQVDYNCYPLEQPPSFACTLTGVCYDFDNAVE